MRWLIVGLAVIGTLILAVAVIVGVAMYLEWDMQRGYDKVYRPKEKK